MCTVCGCGTAAIEQENDQPHQHSHEHGHLGHDGHALHQHGHPHEHKHEPSQSPLLINFGAGLAGVEVPGMSQARTIRIEQDILSRNAAYAQANRERFLHDSIVALNLMSSPGSGKTSLLVRMVTELKQHFPIAVIEGDQQTSNDAQRIRATGAAAIQINTGKGCHLDAHMVGHAFEHLPPMHQGLLFIENVGNLVCPAAFDLGEACKIVVLSVTEGEDKPIKYPDMFAAADLMLLNKINLLPHLDFDLEACLAAAKQVNPRLDIVCVSARTGEGLAEVYAWLDKHFVGTIIEHTATETEDKGQKDMPCP